MSPWSRAYSTRWAQDVADADDDDTHSQRLPVPVLQQTTPDRSSLKAYWKRMRQNLSPSISRTTLIDEQKPHSLDGLSSAALETSTDTEIDEVVVDQCWTKEYSSSSRSSVADDSAVDGRDDDFEERYNPTAKLERTGVWASWWPLAVLRWGVWPGVKKFFDSRFPDPKLELEYQKEVWDEGKRLAELAAAFFFVNWLMALLSIPNPTVTADKVFNYGISSFLSVPVFLFCRYDFPMKYPWFYQTFICISTWCWAFYQIIYVYLCGYYSSDLHIFTCGSKDFLSTFYYASAMQVVALFGAHLRRIPAMIGATAFLIFSSVLIIPHRSSWYRNIINFLAFQGFLLYMHYQREMSARRLHLARIRLKLQIEKTSQAQVNERKAADSKYRLTSYVRVPLNTAILAVQNMDASGAVPKDMLLEFNALEGSLSQMSKVLNDVLDFNRMDSGNFEVLMRPYAFHQVLRSMFLTLELATSARELDFETDLDPKIDDYVRRAQYRALGESDESINKLMKENPTSDAHSGIVCGDENRLRQIVTNLAGNACKFTPKGGKLRISTRLVLPDLSDGSDAETSAGSDLALRSSDDLEKSVLCQNLDERNRMHSLFEEAEKVVVRIEVTDTGLGIAPKDMANASIFSAFIQTEQGRTQGGKGTGLGLALVRRIVKLSGGRLGVRSKVGCGSTFWVELPLGVGSKVLNTKCDDRNEIAGVPPFNIYPLSSTKSLDESVESQNHGNSVDHIDLMALRAAQMSPLSTRSPAALHGLMNQGGSVELSLAKYNTNSPVPTRTLGDPSTGTDYPMHLEDVNGVSSPLDTREKPQTTLVRCRPTYIPLPSPQSFTLDGGQLQPATGVGTTAIERSSTPPIPRSGPATSALFNQYQVLVVDDDAMTRRLMTRMLERHGCCVTTAANGEIALGILMGTMSDIQTPDSERSGPTLEQQQQQTCSPRSSRTFTVVFLDNQMPVMSGLKTVAQLRQAGRNDFVVGVTGNALIADQKEYLDAGADYVLTKPVLERSLTAMLVEADKKRKAA